MGEKKRRLQAASGSAAGVVESPGYEALLSEGSRLRAQRQARDALSCFERAYRLAPERPEALHLLGRTYFELGQRDVGLALLQRAVKLQPELLASRMGYAYALSATSKYEQAADELRAAVRLAPEDAQSRRDLGAVMVHLGRLDEAERWYREAAERAAGRPDLHEALAGLYYRRDALDAARASFERAVAIDPRVATRMSVGSARSAPAAAGSTTIAGAAAAAAVNRVSIDGEATPFDEVSLARACAARRLVIIDDVLPDPLDYRSRALDLDFSESSDAAAVSFPGRQTAGQPCQPIMERIASELGTPVKWLSPDNGAFRVSDAGARARWDVHVDPDDGSPGVAFAALLYLTLPQDCRGGTSFWRHRATGWQQRPSAEQLRAGGYGSFADFERRRIDSERPRPFGDLVAARRGQWDFLLEIPLRFNRLAIYRADYFHAVSTVFGASEADGRLVQLFYFKAIAGVG